MSRLPGVMILAMAWQFKIYTPLFCNSIYNPCNCLLFYPVNICRHFSAKSEFADHRIIESHQRSNQSNQIVTSDMLVSRRNLLCGLFKTLPITKDVKELNPNCGGFSVTVTWSFRPGLNRLGNSSKGMGPSEICIPPSCCPSPSSPPPQAQICDCQHVCRPNG